MLLECTASMQEALDSILRTSETPSPRNLGREEHRRALVENDWHTPIPIHNKMASWFQYMCF